MLRKFGENLTHQFIDGKAFRALLISKKEMNDIAIGNTYQMDFKGEKKIEQAVDLIIGNHDVILIQDAHEYPKHWGVKASISRFKLNKNKSITIEFMPKDVLKIFEKQVKVNGSLQFPTYFEDATHIDCSKIKAVFGTLDFLPDDVKAANQKFMCIFLWAACGYRYGNKFTNFFKLPGKLRRSLYPKKKK